VQINSTITQDLQGSLNVASGVTTVNGAVDQSGEGTIAVADNSTLSVSGGITSTGDSTITMAGANSVITGNITNGDAGVPATASVTLRGTVNGNVINQGGASDVVVIAANTAINGTVDNLGAATFNVSDGNLSGVSTFTNAGTTTVSATRGLTATSVVNTGALNVNGQVVSTISNDSGGVVTVAATTGNVTGLITNGATAASTVNSAGVLSGGLTNSQAGIVNLSGGSVASTVNNDGDLNITGNVGSHKRWCDHVVRCRNASSANDGAERGRFG
jgi:hypothetical protein